MIHLHHRLQSFQESTNKIYSEDSSSGHLGGVLDSLIFHSLTFQLLTIQLPHVTTAVFSSSPLVVVWQEVFRCWNGCEVCRRGAQGIESFSRCEMEFRLPSHQPLVSRSQSNHHKRQCRNGVSFAESLLRCGFYQDTTLTSATRQQSRDQRVMKRKKTSMVPSSSLPFPSLLPFRCSSLPSPSPCWIRFLGSSVIRIC